MAGYLKRRKAASAIYLILVCLIAAGPLLIRLRRPAEIKIIGSKEASADALPATQAIADDEPKPLDQNLTGSNAVPATDSRSSSPITEGNAQERMLFVHVAGQVVKPGLYELPKESRVHHAIEAAGGFSSDADRDSVNIALPVSDGQQVFIPKKAVQTSAAPVQKAQPVTVKEAAVGSSTTTSAEEPEGRLDVTASVPATKNGQSDAASGSIDINSASATQLEELPGIGPSTAAKIIQHRKDNGPFTSIEGLMDVSGIGPAKFAAIKDLVTVK